MIAFSPVWLLMMMIFLSVKTALTNFIKLLTLIQLNNKLKPKSSILKILGLMLFI